MLQPRGGAKGRLTLVSDWESSFPTAVRYRDYVCRFEDTALEWAFVAVFGRVGIFRIIGWERYVSTNDKLRRLSQADIF